MNSVTSPPLPTKPSLWQELRALPGSFWVLFWGMFINRAGTFVYPFLTITLGRRGFSTAEIGIALGGYGAGALFASLGGGWFADRFGRKLSIVVGTFANALAILALGAVNDLVAVTLLTVCAGFSTSFYGPAINALVADVVPQPLQLRAYAALRVALNAGFACGTAVGGFLVSSAPRWIFWGDAITTAAYGLLAVFLLPNGVHRPGKQASWAFAWGILRRDRVFWRLVGMEICVSLIWAQFSTTYAQDILQRGLTCRLFGINYTSEGVFGLLVGLNGLLIMLLELPATRFTQKLNLPKAMRVGLLLQGMGFAMIAVPLGIPWLVFCMTVFTAGEIFYSPVHSAFIAQIAPPDMRGRYQGALSFGSCLGRTVGPSIGFGVLAMHPTLLWLGCGVVAALGTCFVWGVSSRTSSTTGALEK